jgi:hypothetical protein
LAGLRFAGYQAIPDPVAARALSEGAKQKTERQGETKEIHNRQTFPHMTLLTIRRFPSAVS